jgi:transcription antitermination factor NusG
MMEYWALATTQSNCEARVIDRLKWLGIVSYAPTYRRIHFRQGRRFERSCQLFPGYLFVRVMGAWRSLLTTHGIHTVLGGANPSRVPEGMVEDLMSKQGVEDGNVVLPWRVGQLLRVKDGTLAGELVIYEGMGRHARERVLLKAMGGYVPVEINGSNLEAVA